jgi:hypothetical protein
MAELLSYAQALRVIGQELDALSVDSFELARWGDDYVVWPKRTERADKGLVSKITQMILGHDDSSREIPNRIYFTSTEILWADTQRRLKRQIGSPTDRRDRSFVLRVLGDYLDRKNARHFTISWSRDSTSIRYDQIQEIFTTQNLYDLGIRMYLRRPPGAGAK